MLYKNTKKLYYPRFILSDGRDFQSALCGYDYKKFIDDHNFGLEGVKKAKEFTHEFTLGKIFGRPIEKVEEQIFDYVMKEFIEGVDLHLTRDYFKGKNIVCVTYYESGYVWCPRCLDWFKEDAPHEHTKPSRGLKFC